MSEPAAPLARLTSIRTKLGALVAVSVVVAAVVATVGDRAGVPAWLALPITVALALAVTQLLAVGMTSPLREMTSAARRMAAGDHAVRVRADAADEVGELARAFNTMAADLGEVDQRRRDLVATVSHELRTPLAGLVAVLENLDDGVTPTGPDAVRTALVQAERLSGLVADLLDLSRLEAGAVPLDPVPVAVRRLLDAAVAEARALPRDVAWAVTAPDDLVVEADPARLHQLVANLLDNASRHSPPAGTVRVEAHAPGDGTWVLEVANAGDPIEPADRERVFTRFGSTDPGGGGSGLGLAIARWVGELHGGTLTAVDPRPGEDGARLRAVLPLALPASPAPTPTAQDGWPEAAQVSPAGRGNLTGSAETSPHPVRECPPASVPVAATRPVPGLPAAPPNPPAPPSPTLFSWPSDAPAAPRLLGAAALVGLLAALLVVDHRPGLGATLVLLAGGAVVLAAHPRRREPWTLACAGLAAALVSVLALRDALWIGVLCCLAATVLVVVASTRVRTLLGVLLSGIAWPLSAVVGLPWLGRTVRAVSGSGRALAVVRTALVAGVALLVVGALLASADAVLADWLGALVPDQRIDLTVARVFVGLAVAGLVLATAFLALRPPVLDVDAPRRPTRHRWEWLVPVLAVDGVLVLFLVAQAAAVVGGHEYVERTTGLTYAEHTRQGFGQLTAVTLLTVLVVGVAARKASVETAADRRWLRGSLGALCALTLVVVAGALHRLALYTDSYGLTRLRLLAGTFELWLGLVVVALAVAGIGLHGAWLARAAVLSGPAVLLALALADPDAQIARVNIERQAAAPDGAGDYRAGALDVSYLAGLSADAVPALLDLPPSVRGCALATLAERARAERSPWEWNLGARHLDAAAAAGGADPDCATYLVPGDLATVR